MSTARPARLIRSRMLWSFIFGAVAGSLAPVARLLNWPAKPLNKRSSFAEVRHMHVTSLGRVIDDPIAGPIREARTAHGPATPRLPGPDASFNGGSYRVEAGMAQGEMLAATYTLTAADFPIHIDFVRDCLLEPRTPSSPCRRRRSGSVLYYSGTPLAGSLVDTASRRMGTSSPHIIIPPGSERRPARDAELYD